ncbi:MAG TPA: methyltransferase domain-containing protein [Fimbriiglobus sp.]|jgi:SAM-dependent methyltransferase|nr:methyltransferase domain-containing protein [Fimbriiglobus sp.]
MARLAALVPTPLRPIARKVRDYLRSLDRSPLDRVLAADDCRAVIEVATPSLLVERRGSTPCRVRVRNIGSAVWSPHGRRPVGLTLRWFTARKAPLDLPVTRCWLPGPVPPGATADITATVTAPDYLGHFLVEIDLAQADGPSSRDAGCRPVRVEVQITGRDAEDIDYHKAYATADLTRDYWTVVGPGTREEYDRLGESKLQTLRDAGLTPDGRVLDVGCGTGQLAVPLESFLGDRGLYFGTDIGEEAIAFCKERFKQPNFRFARNDTTSLPVEGVQFDFVTFFSVFTHTYPDETVLLLAEANRLLAPDGVVIGDVFTSPVVERCSGNRGAMELNREHFLKLVRLAGLSPTVLASWPWQKFGRREVFQFTRLAGGAAG